MFCWKSKEPCSDAEAQPHDLSLCKVYFKFPEGVIDIPGCKSTAAACIGLISILIPELSQ